MRSWLVVAAVAFLLAAVVVEAPAGLIDRQLGALSDGQMRIADATGTIWSGSGALVLLPYGAHVPLRWHIDALPLLSSRLSGTLGTDSTESRQAAFYLDSDGFSLRNFAIALPAEALLRTSDAPAIISGAGGIVDVRADAFALHRGVFEGGFVARWQGASLPAPRPGISVALGDVRLDGVGSGSEIRCVLSNAGGDIDIGGTLNLTATGARVDARLKPRAGIDAERSKAIVAALSMIGAADDSGGFRLVWEGSAR
jgi:hypothetical protein